MAEQEMLPVANTDRELWREREGDYYANSIHVTDSGAIGINVNGTVIVKPLPEWHRLAATKAADERETFASVIQWGDETFGPCTADRALSRAMEEKAELDDELAKPVRDDEAIAIEAADVVICMLRVPGILSAIERKMAINRKRTWNVGTDGTGYHVKEGAALAEAGGRHG